VALHLWGAWQRDWPSTFAVTWWSWWLQSKRGWLWSYTPMDVNEWTATLRFRTSGSGRRLYGDGFAIWFTQHQMFNEGVLHGFTEKFVGTAASLARSALRVRWCAVHMCGCSARRQLQWSGGPCGAVVRANVATTSADVMRPLVACAARLRHRV
jgi:hypothetical protein